MKLSFYLATKNPNKLEEVQDIFTNTGIKVLPCPEGIVLPEETGKTFEENALIKARHLKNFVGGEIVAGEDSGLAVQKLNGAPGIFSARFAGPDSNDRENMEKLLDMLTRYKSAEERKAKFITAVACIGPAGEKIFRGEVRGFITGVPRGKKGFGYDPVFEYPESGKTFAELTPEEKNKISHRCAAFTKLADYLIKSYNNSS